MRVPSETQALQQIANALSSLLDVPAEEMHLHIQPRNSRVDGIIEAGRYTFVVEWKGVGSAAAVERAVRQVEQPEEAADRSSIPLVAVPFMGEVGQRYCEEAGISWMDLSGNATITAPGLRILSKGQPNKYKRPGRPASAFAPKSSRIARWLLMHHDTPMTQREIAVATDMDEGFTSRIVAKLESNGLVLRGEDGTIKPHDPDLLLDAWGEEYDFDKHDIVRGHIPTRSGEALIEHLNDVLNRLNIEYAMTGLGSAWLHTHFAAFRTASVYLREHPSFEVLQALKFREEPRGANTWLVIPRDVGVFHGAGDVEGARCVHPVQNYLDLQAHPERSKEAAERLRTELLKW